MSRTEWLAYFQIVLIFSTLPLMDALPLKEVLKLRALEALSKAGFLVKVVSLTGESLGETLINVSNVPKGIGMIISALFSGGAREQKPPGADPNCEKGGLACKIKSVLGLK
ncbi:uncharacterized protein LOC117588181 [Drosophila guanche]|uniref:Uncharacterized protein n=1 Tax=Drosophila guanche TaxID=7266 RepID=A0A3B0KJY5_DROGU|nr:uncharacterized protein LOC117588181 [Drosophila guanche]SPP86066.1 Hypothetical predicted protein [Drosophila guanche]